MPVSFRTKTERIQKDLEVLAQYTDGSGEGITRLTYTPEEMAARRYLAAEMEKAGMAVRLDAAGNVVGRIEGSRPELPILMIGSHIDSIRNGGNFDGMAGVVAGIEVARAIHDAGITPLRSIEVVGITGEENSRFFPGVVGSRAMVGELPPDEINSTVGADGVPLADAMRECGLDPARIAEAIRPAGSIYMYFELHIEQCKVLEMTKTPVGVVTSICGAAHHDITVYGQADHAGGTPMDMRSDAVMAVAEAALEAERLAVEAGHNTVATFGKLDVSPNIPNVIPGEVHVVADIRSSDASCNKFVMDGIERKLDEVCARRGCTYTAHQTLHGEATIVPDGMIALLTEKANALGIKNRLIYSGAGHDAVVMNAVTPVAMLFVPSRGGRSHCPEEWTDYADIRLGTEVLLDGVLALAMDGGDTFKR